MRVIAGTAGGIPLELPGHDLRPTMDKVKGAIFSSLGDCIAGARVLDLFAGSGALGIEALSRGAAEACLVDLHPQAVRAMEVNLGKCRLQGKIQRDDVFRWLKNNTATFDLVFADPPYLKNPPKGAGKPTAAPDFASDLLNSTDLVRALAPEGLFILERAPRPGDLPGNLFDLVRRKTYGATEVLILRAA